MVQPKELRIGNWTSLMGNVIAQVIEIRSNHIKSTYKRDSTELPHTSTTSYNDVIPIPLTPEVLEKCKGFYQLQHFTIPNNWMYSLGRDRYISIACVGTPNEMVFLTEESQMEVKSVVVLRNYDYDGKTYLHQIQNIIFDLTGQELEYKP